MRRLASWLSPLIVLIAACSGGVAATTTTSRAPTSAVDSFQLEPYSGEGFEILLPSRWTVVGADDITSGGLAALIEEGMSGMDLPAGMDSDAFADQIAALFAQGGKLFALDVIGSSPGFVDNINIIMLPLPGLTAEGVLAVTVQQFEDVFGATVTSSEVEQLPAGEAAVVRYRGFTPVIEGISVTILTDTQQWAITLSASDADRLDAMFVAMLESFREVG
jgi:hypothetical protein